VTDDPHGVRVGILLARRPADLGEWLADGAAFEAAGADALWVDLAPDQDVDPAALTAALAALTFRSLLVSTLPESAGTARTLATISRLSRGRLRILARDDSGVGLPEIGIFHRVARDRGPYVPGYGGDEDERWVWAPPPESRTAWQETLRATAERGFHGLLVSADPRLVDLLRNPDDPGQRLDLHLASG
jgi:hypothetical protein